jgi:hypothetical protein
MNAKAKTQESAPDLVGIATAAIESVDNANILADFDSGGTDTKQIDSDAASWIFEGLLQALCYNIENGLVEGRKMIAKAEDQLASAMRQDTERHDEKSQERLEGRLDWLSRMHCQQAYREALSAPVKDFYESVTGLTYVLNKSNNVETAPRDTAASKAAARILANRS